MSIRSIETSGGTLRIAIGDGVEPEDLGEIAEALQRAARSGGRVQVSFRDARDCTPSSLLTLTTLLSAMGVTYELVGLSLSNQRVLRYLEAQEARPDGIEPSGDAGEG